MTIAAPADKRFRRAHVHPARRRPWLPSWPKLVVVAFVCGGGVYAATLTAPRVADALRIDTITVDGTHRMSTGEVLAVLDGLRGRSMVTTDLEAWRDRLRGSPWVADAAIRRVFPATVSVVVAERQPLGIGRIGAALYLVDRSATIIDEFGPSYAEFDLPIIDGLAAAPTPEGSPIDGRRAALAGRVLAALQERPDLAKRVSQIDVSDVRGAVVMLKDDTALIRVGEERFVERVQTYLDLAPRLRAQVPEIDYVDLRFDERVYVRPLGSPRDLRRTGGS